MLEKVMGKMLLTFSLDASGSKHNLASLVPEVFQLKKIKQRKPIVYYAYLDGFFIILF